MELRNWFVDTVSTFKARVGNKLLLMQATRLATSLREFHRLEAEAGRPIPRALTKLPVINESWLRAWRHENGITWRCVTIVYKVSREKLRFRLGVLWRNNIRLRVLHRYLFGPDRLRMVATLDTHLHAPLNRAFQGRPPARTDAEPDVIYRACCKRCLSPLPVGRCVACSWAGYD